jgi:hypothetical protein
LKKRNYIDSLTFRVSNNQRQAIEVLSMKEEKGIGEVARELLDAGLRSRGIEC